MFGNNITLQTPHTTYSREYVHRVQKTYARSVATRFSTSFTAWYCRTLTA